MQNGTPLGAECLGQNRCRFHVWAPNADGVQVVLQPPGKGLHDLKPSGEGYYTGVVEGVNPGSRYMYRLNFRDREPVTRPDPASRFQPEGVHGPSGVTAAPDGRTTGWSGISPANYIIYELHVGAFTPAGTFEAIIPRLDALKELGITAIEIMPVAQFPGSRNWGYDGVFPFAVQNSYGGPPGLRRLVHACHDLELAVILDVVYNHLGPEGNFLRDFGPYFTEDYKTPWGEAVNFDGPMSDHVRRFFIENALYWVSTFRIDALRVDAVHAIKDFSAHPFLMELAEAVHLLAEKENRKIGCIAESDLNDTRIIRPRTMGGFEFDAQWSDDFHHSLHALLTGEKDGYYRDFGKIGDLAKAYSEGFVYSGQYSAHRGRRHGNSSRSVPASRFVVCGQNHDQVGNRMLGERLSRLAGFEQLKLAAGAVLLSPFIPLLFMGEEYGEPAPFLYFISHEDEQLVRRVREGRRNEFAAFGWAESPPDPQSEETFVKSRLDPDLVKKSPHAELYAFYRHLIRMRREIPALARLRKKTMAVDADEMEKIIVLRRWSKKNEVLILMNFSDRRNTREQAVHDQSWSLILDSASEKWAGPGAAAPERIEPDDRASIPLAAHSVVVYEKETTPLRAG